HQASLEERPQEAGRGGDGFLHAGRAPAPLIEARERDLGLAARRLSEAIACSVDIAAPKELIDLLRQRFDVVASNRKNEEPFEHDADREHADADEEPQHPAGAGDDDDVLESFDHESPFQKDPSIPTLGMKIVGPALVWQ